MGLLKWGLGENPPLSGLDAGATKAVSGMPSRGAVLRGGRAPVSPASQQLGESYARHRVADTPSSRQLGDLVGALSRPLDPSRRPGPASSLGSTPTMIGDSTAARGTIWRNLPNDAYGLSNLVEHLHGVRLRADLTAEMLAKGYPSGPTPASTGLVRNSWRGPLPPIQYHSMPGVGTHFDPVRGGVRIAAESVAPAPDRPLLPDQGLVLHHELEHARQLGFGATAVPDDRRLMTWRDQQDADEIAPSIADLAYSAEAYRRHTGRDLQEGPELDPPPEMADGFRARMRAGDGRPVAMASPRRFRDRPPVAPNVLMTSPAAAGNREPVSHSSNWIASQARQHGLFDGKSMTQLLATPSGQAYTRRLINGSRGFQDVPDPYVAAERGMQKGSTMLLRKSAFDMNNLGETLGRPEVLGPLLASQPQLTSGLAQATGGLGNAFGKAPARPLVGGSAGNPMLANLDAGAAKSVAATPAFQHVNRIVTGGMKPPPPTRPVGSPLTKAAPPPAPPTMVGDSQADRRAIAGQMLQRPVAAKNLSATWLHAVSPRATAVSDMRAQGYPAGPTAAGTQLVADSWRGKVPVQVTDSEYGPHYRADKGVVLPPGSFAARPGLGEGGHISPDPAFVLRHELEHARQNGYAGPTGGQTPSRAGSFGDRPAARGAGVPLTPGARGALSAANEVPASLGDIPYYAEAYRRHMGRDMAGQAQVTPGWLNPDPVKHDYSWMASQARQHGLFDGKSMTQLLATPSGQQYLKRLLDKSDPANYPGMQKGSTMLLRKSAFDMNGLGETLGRPEVLGPLLASQPQLTSGLAQATGGVGIMGLMDMLRHGGANIGSLFKGPLAGRGGAPGMPTAASNPPPLPQPKRMPAAGNPPPIPQPKMAPAPSELSPNVRGLGGPPSGGPLKL